MDFESIFNSWGLGVLISGYLKKFMDLLILLILLYSSLKFLHLSVIGLGFLGRFVNWWSSDRSKKTSNCKCGLMNLLKETVNCRKMGCFDEDYGDGKQVQCDVDKVFDVMSLRKLVKLERQRASDAYVELEKERMASTTAAEEAMGMIMRLQNEKSVVELQAQQHRRLSHEKQVHDQEVIQSLRWIVMKHESERSLLEDRLRLCKQRLMLCMNDDGGDDGCDLSLSCLDERLVSSLDLGLSPW